MMSFLTEKKNTEKKNTEKKNTEKNIEKSKWCIYQYPHTCEDRFGRLHRFELFAEKIIGTTLVNTKYEHLGKIIDVKHECCYHHRSLGIFLYFEKGESVSALFYDNSGKMKILVEEVVFEKDHAWLYHSND